MNKILCIIGLLLLTGCGVFPSSSDDRDASYAVVSEADAGTIFSRVKGSVCKVTTVGDVSTWKLEFEGDSCKATLNGGIESGKN